MQHQTYFGDISKNVQIYEGDARETIDRLFGASTDIINLRLLYWFREGWEGKDIQRIVDLCNDFLPNLELMVCDMNSATLQRKFKLKKNILTTLSFHGALRGYKNCRTIWVHQLDGNRKDHGQTSNPIERSFLQAYSLQSVITIEQSICTYWDQQRMAKFARPSFYKRLSDYEHKANANEPAPAPAPAFESAPALAPAPAPAPALAPAPAPAPVQKRSRLHDVKFRSRMEQRGDAKAKRRLLDKNMKIVSSFSFYSPEALLYEADFYF